MYPGTYPGIYCMSVYVYPCSRCRVRALRYPGNARGGYVLRVGIHLPLFPHRSSSDAVIHMQGNPPQKRILVGCSSPFMRLAEHITALRAWCKQCMPGRLVKTRRAPSRRCRDARCYGRIYIYKTTAVHDVSKVSHNVIRSSCFIPWQ